MFEVKRRKARKARNPRTGEKVDVEPKNVVTFKPGKEMEERVRQMELVAEELSPAEEAAADMADEVNGQDEVGGGAAVKTKTTRSRKSS